MFVASADTNTVIGITVAMTFIVFFSLGVLVTTCICCMVKKRSKVPLHRPMESSRNDIITVDEKMATEMEPDAVYDDTVGQVRPATEVELDAVYEAIDGHVQPDAMMHTYL